MIRAIVLFVSLFFSATAFAGGQLTIQGNHFEGSGKIYPMVGLAVYQHLVGNLALNSWLGVGGRPVGDERKDWGSVKLGFDYHLGRFTFGAGGFMNHAFSPVADVTDQINLNPASNEYGAFGKVSIKLW